MGKVGVDQVCQGAFEGVRDGLLLVLGVHPSKLSSDEHIEIKLVSFLIGSFGVRKFLVLVYHSFLLDHLGLCHPLFGSLHSLGFDIPGLGVGSLNCCSGSGCCHGWKIVENFLKRC